MTEAKGESGQISILILGMCVIALTVILGATAVTSVHLSRMAMIDAADTAALDAADDGGRLAYSEGVDVAAPLSDATVRRSAADSLARREPPTRVSALHITGATGTPDGRTAVVVLTGDVDVPLVGGLIRSLGGSVTVTVESRARAVTPAS
ncbi:pilus assembly protein TadG-related protein [Janibacter sp. GXQ6167]|uniref:pilus assembly protein TadG-related protein n=1 Tax=Janibacter sp. GXQ6167 TaxID=3240791 RepID=UPI003523F59A